MLLGLHAYSLHLHGMGQNWGGFKLQWEPVWDIFSLMDEAIGSDVGKISMDIHRPHPVCGSAFHPEVIPQLENIARKAQAAASVIQSKPQYETT